MRIGGRFLEFGIGLLIFLDSKLEVHDIGHPVSEGQVAKQEETLAGDGLALATGSDMVDPDAALVTAPLPLRTLRPLHHCCLLAHAEILGNEGTK
jgi:hypothetical protein